MSSSKQSFHHISSESYELVCVLTICMLSVFTARLLFSQKVLEAIAITYR